MPLCIQDLVELTGGRLWLAAMPPVDGELAPIHRIVLSAEDAGPGDVYCGVARSEGDIEHAFLRGAIGAITGGRVPEPWPGRFCLQVDDPVAALCQIVGRLLADANEVSSLPSPEL
jgi:hypothetical protein